MYTQWALCSVQGSGSELLSGNLAATRLPPRSGVRGRRYVIHCHNHHHDDDVGDDHDDDDDYDDDVIHCHHRRHLHCDANNDVIMMYDVDDEFDFDDDCVELKALQMLLSRITQYSNLDHCNTINSICIELHILILCQMLSGFYGALHKNE